MTAEPDLLPSSVAAFTEALHGERGPLDAWLEVNDEREVRAHVEAYAHACVARATAAKDAEVEALRAEVERANGWNERVSVCRDHVADIVDGPCVICALDAAEARAERLAEVLQWYAEQVEGCRKIGSIGEPFRKELDRDGGKRARAALNPTAAQENDDA